MTFHNGPFVAFGSVAGLRVRDCYTCGFAHLDPLPTPEQIAAYYGDSDWFYKQFSPRTLEKERLEHRRGWWSPWWAPYYEWRARSLPHGLLVDIGAGAGWFARHWQKTMRGVAVGIEPSQTCRDFALNHLGVWMYPDWDTLEKQSWWRSLSGGRHVNLNMSFVLEHIQDPQTFLKECVAHMQPGDRLAVTVPNELNPLQRRIQRTQRYGSWWVSRVHVNYFTPFTLQTILIGAGLRVIQTSATFPMELFQLLGANYIDNPRIGSWCHRMRLMFESLAGPHIFDFYGFLMRNWNVGREVTMICMKD